MPRKGEHCTEEAKAKISAARRGSHLSPETRAKIGASNIGKHGQRRDCVCESCGATFHIKPSQIKEGRGRFCSRKCYAIWMSKKVKCICKTCKSEFYVKPSDIKNRRVAFCSATCYGIARIGKPLSDETRKRMRGNAPMKQPGAAKKVSEALKGRPKPWMKGEGNPAKHPSVREKISKALKGRPIPWHLNGDKHPNWQGGKSFEPYCPKFTKEFKERVRAFWDFKCGLCGRTQKENKRALSVHHVNYRKDACCDEEIIRQFIPLCTSCHGQSNYNRKKQEEELSGIIEKKHGGQCYFKKGETLPAWGIKV
jgi:hypothetical protein